MKAECTDPAQLMTSVLSAQDSGAPWVGLRSIQDLGKARALPKLRRLVASQDRGLRQIVCVALGNVAGKRAVRLLVKAMTTDPSVDVRQQAAHALSHSIPWRERDAAYDALRDAFVDRRQHGHVRGQAAEGLGNILGWGDRRLRRFREAEAFLIKGLGDDSPEVRFWSAYSLGKMRSRKALPEVQRLAATDQIKCRNWWLISDEASDSIEAIKGFRRHSRNCEWDGPYEDDAAAS